MRFADIPFTPLSEINSPDSSGERTPEKAYLRALQGIANRRKQFDVRDVEEGKEEGSTVRTLDEKFMHQSGGASSQYDQASGTYIEALKALRTIAFALNKRDVEEGKEEGRTVRELDAKFAEGIKVGGAGGERGR